MSLVRPYSVPLFLRRGFAETLDADVYTKAGVQQTATVGTVSLYAGSRLIVDGASATALGPPATYSLAAQAATEPLSDRWLEVWTLTIGGVQHQFSRPAYLVRRILDPTILDTDLSAVHTDLDALRDPDDSTYETQRELAWVRLQKMLIKKGNRPQLVFDSWGLRDLHVYLTLELIFSDFASSVGDGRYLKLADKYRAAAAAEFEDLQLDYDFDEDGTRNEDEGTKAATPVTFLSSSWGWWN